MGATFKWHFFLKFPSGSPKIGTFVEFWIFKFSSNQTYLEHASELFYSHEKDLSNDVLNAPIGNHLTPTLRVFVVRIQIPNLTSNLFLKIITHAKGKNLSMQLPILHNLDASYINS